MTRSPRLGFNKFLWLIAVAPLGLAASPASATSCRELIVRCQHQCAARYDAILKNHWTVQAQNERTVCLNDCETRSYGQCEGSPDQAARDLMLLDSWQSGRMPAPPRG
jgi:hypothetical protein